MARDITRRRMAAVLASPLPILGQATDARPRDPVDEAREQVQGAIRELEEVELEIDVQPAFVFKP